MSNSNPNAVAMRTEFFASDTIEQTARRTGFVKRVSKITVFQTVEHPTGYRQKHAVQCLEFPRSGHPAGAHGRQRLFLSTCTGGEARWTW